MDTDNLLKNSVVDEQINIIGNCLRTVCDGLFHLFCIWRNSKEKQNVLESEAIAQCILQMVVCKIRTLLVMCDGINVKPENNTIRILDIPSLLSVLRSLYEMVFVFHNIYAEQATKRERDIFLYIWEIRGLNNRQNLPIVPISYKKKENNEKRQIDDMKHKIGMIAKELNLPDEISEQLNNVVSSKSVDIKGYRFKKDYKNRIIAFESYRYEEGAEALLGTDAPTYRFLSIHSHPSYLGVLQFGQMFNSNVDRNFLKTILTCACKLASTIAMDFYNHIDDADDAFSQLTESEKDFIITLHKC